MLKTPAGTRFCVNPTPWNVWCDRRWWCLWAYPKHLQPDGLSTFSYFGVKLLIAHQMYYYTRVIHARTPADRRFWHFFILWCAAIYWVPGVLWCTCDALKNTCRQTFWAVFFSEMVLSVLLRARCIVIQLWYTPEHLQADVLCTSSYVGVKLLLALG